MDIMVATKIGIIPLPIQIVRLNDSELSQLNDNLYGAYQALIKLNESGKVENKLEESALMDKILNVLRETTLAYCNALSKKDLPKLLVPASATIIDINSKK